jgi:putative hydroxymethylpyrimidine transport system substrate-binding protein
VVLDGHLGPANAALRIAEERGFFEDVGLEVLASDPVVPGRPVEYVTTYTDDLGISQEPQVVLGKSKGASVVAIGSLLPQPTAALIWLRKSKLRSIADLRGKTIAVAGIPYQKALLEQVLRQGGLTLEDVKIRWVRYTLLRALRSGRADAIIGSWNIEGAALKAQGLEPVIRRVRDLGIPPYEELVVITRPDWLHEHPQTARRFMSALARGVEAAERNPQATAKLIGRDGERNRLVGPKGIEAGLEATLPLLSEDQHMDLGKARRLIDWMHARGMIETKPPVDQLFTNDYLARPGGD